VHHAPLTLTARSALTLPVEIDGRTFTFQLDTGASETVIKRSTWQLLGLPSGTLTETRGAGGTIIDGAELVPLPELRIGDASVRDLTVGVMSFEELGDLDGIDGVLGQDVLRRYITEVDVPRGRFTLHARASRAWLDDELVAIPYVDALGLIRIDGELDGLALAAIFDLGAAATIANHRAAPHAVAGRGAAALGADGQPLVMATARRRSLAIGDLTFAAADLFVSDLPVFDVFGLAELPAVILGMDLLGSRRMVIDPDERLLYISR
jgi:hypothetical protein